MLRWVDRRLNRITMYRLVLYHLIFLVGVAVVLSATGILHYDPYALTFSTAFLVAVCALTNAVFARVYGVPANAESAYISALILALIITPIQSAADLWFLGWAAVLAMASKYIVAIGSKHLFNPVAFAVALTYLALNQSASWWVGSGPLLPFTLLGSLLLVRKLQRFDLFLTFLAVSLASILAFGLLDGEGLGLVSQRTLLLSPLVFFAGVILTEPLTTPPTRPLRVAYGALVAFLFTPQIHLGSFYTTPEIAILIGNVFAYLVSPKAALALRLKEKVQLAPDVYDFVFTPARPLAFKPGQYMEWTLGHADPDNRGNRRYFTLASSPTERDLRLGVKFYPNSSTFKEAMLAMDEASEIKAGQLAGDYVLPNDPRQKCVFVAGGIGITPFRSMIQYLLDTHQRRPIVLFYANKTVDEIVYRDVLDRAARELGIKTIYALSDSGHLPDGWRGQVGHFTPKMIKAAVPDYRRCLFYVSGPQAMIDSFLAVLRRMRVPRSHIKTDFFPGFA
jgi:ferredoxin-NADP reductase